MTGLVGNARAIYIGTKDSDVGDSERLVGTALISYIVLFSSVSTLNNDIYLDMFKGFSFTVFLLLAVGYNLLPGCTGGSKPTQQLLLPVELRGVWITQHDRVLESRESIATAMQFLADHHFNVVFPVVWNDGMTLFPSTTMKVVFGIEIDTLAAYKGRDPLAEVIEEARKHGIAVIPYFEGGFSAGNSESIIIRSKPHWAARDRTNKIAVKDGVAWLNAFLPEVQNFMFAIIGEVVQKYDIDGVQGGTRLPAQPIEAGYDSVFAAEYTDLHAGTPPPLDISEKHWKFWRAVRLNTFARQVYWKVKATKPKAVVSWSPFVYPWSLDEYLQDWRIWISKSPDGEYSADIMHPRIFRPDIESYKRTLESQHRDSLRIHSEKRYLYPGVLLHEGTFTMSDEFLKEAIRYNRYLGYNGEVFYSYEGLRRDNDRLAKVLKSTHYRLPAKLPFTPSSRKDTSDNP
ncbi:MAG: family 10 glycosylhydrolase [Bacteroidetes bacterium]|nr:family 10 glycosylhydrolase [Bacteroidota bacterium]MCW5895428.1 family 10 glycosylhydrolase [Bacteroidota bacterium]